MTQLAITGATGGIGSRVARRLADRGVSQRLVVRDPARAPALPDTTVAQAAYGDDEAMRAALAGVHTLLLVSATESEDRIARHLSAVDAAAAAGVSRIVYTSFVGAGPDATFTLARHHWRTEEQIRSSGVAYTFLRDSLYQDVLPYFVGADGVIRGPAGEGRGGFVCRDDIADAAIEVLLHQQGAYDGRTFDLTGPRSLNLSEIASIISDVCGRDVRYCAETVEEAYASRAGYGAPDWMVDGWVSTYTALAAGELDVVTGDVETLTGHPATSFEDFLHADQAAIDHVRGLGS
jgi:NAD(P)H dehydrogenase (quinone)